MDNPLPVARLVRGNHCDSYPGLCPSPCCFLCPGTAAVSKDPLALKLMFLVQASRVAKGTSGTYCVSEPGERFGKNIKEADVNLSLTLRKRINDTLTFI